ncbi:MAG: hypothetical protein ACE5F1_16350 [Planctomycetota bacterium]
MKIDRILSQILEKTRVVNAGLERAVQTAGRELWPDVKTEDMRVSDFRRGVLHVAVDSHARLAEARGFVGETFRRRVNELIEAERRAARRRGSGRRDPAGVALSRTTDGPYVTRVVFRVTGTL